MTIDQATSPTIEKKNCSNPNKTNIAQAYIQAVSQVPKLELRVNTVTGLHFARCPDIPKDA